jgi:hypothetical protein
MKLLKNGWIVERTDNRSEIHIISIGKISHKYSSNKQLMFLTAWLIEQNINLSRLSLFLEERAINRRGDK